MILIVLFMQDDSCGVKRMVSYVALFLLHLYFFPCDVLILCRIEEAESRILNFLLEFINWKTLPLKLLHILTQRRAKGTWTPQKYFGKDH